MAWRYVSMPVSMRVSARVLPRDVRGALRKLPRPRTRGVETYDGTDATLGQGCHSRTDTPKLKGCLLVRRAPHEDGVRAESAETTREDRRPRRLGARQAALEHRRRGRGLGFVDQRWKMPKDMKE